MYRRMIFQDLDAKCQDVFCDSFEKQLEFDRVFYMLLFCSYISLYTFPHRAHHINFAAWPPPHFIKGSIPEGMSEFVRKLKASRKTIDEDKAAAAKSKAKKARKKKRGRSSD